METFDLIETIEEIDLSKVYIQYNEQNSIIACEGGYTTNNISNINEWTLIDEGKGDRYNLCQAHYFDGGLYTEDGIPRYKYINNEVQLRTEQEIEADKTTILMPTPSNSAYDELAEAYQQGVNEA